MLIYFNTVFLYSFLIPVFLYSFLTPVFTFKMIAIQNIGKNVTKSLTEIKVKRYNNWKKGFKSIWRECCSKNEHVCSYISKQFEPVN